MFEVVEREVTKTEVEKVSVFTCDMCGEKVEIFRPDGPFLIDGNIGFFCNDEPWARMIASHKKENHLCPTCAEKVRGFIKGGEVGGMASFAEGEVYRLQDKLRSVKWWRDFYERKGEELAHHVEETSGELYQQCMLNQTLMDRVEDLEKEVEHRKAAYEFQRLHASGEMKIIHLKPTTYAEACAGLNPFDRVLVRDHNSQKWSNAHFGYKDGYDFWCDNCSYNDCLPYEPYKHLLGTTDSPWEG